MTDAGKPSNARRKKPPAAARVHPDQRANIEGLNAMAAIVYGVWGSTEQKTGLSRRHEGGQA